MLAGGCAVCASSHSQVGSAPPVGDDFEADTRRMLHLLTGAWRTQAVRTMVALDLPDHLAGGALSSQELAARTGTRADLLARLLRALCHPWIGVLRCRGESFALTGLGRRLARQGPGSMRHLALLHGDLFYLSFAGLVDALREERQAFAMVFGRSPSEYLVDRPRQEAIVAAASAEGARAADVLGAVVDLSQARSVTAVGGGGGEWFSDLLDAYPHLDASVLDVPSRIGVARAKLRGREHLLRTSLISGSADDPKVMPRSDVYILVEMLSDRHDQACVALLSAIRAAAPDDSSLLIVERPVPDLVDASSSLATLWDLNRLVNSSEGGRERTRQEYDRLLREAGYQVVGERALGLDLAVIMACPAIPDPSGSFPAGLRKYAR